MHFPGAVTEALSGYQKATKRVQKKGFFVQGKPHFVHFDCQLRTISLSKKLSTFFSKWASDGCKWEIMPAQNNVRPISKTGNSITWPDVNTPLAGAERSNISLRGQDAHVPSIFRGQWTPSQYDKWRKTKRSQFIATRVLRRNKQSYLGARAK